MARIAWNTAGSRFYEAGVDRGVLYIDALAGVPWIGLISVDENPTGGDPTPYYIDGIKYLNLSSDEEFEATIKAYTYPVEFSQCDGTAEVRPGLFFGQQRRKPFGFSYRTMVGSDVGGSENDYKIHLIYDALATPSSRSAASVSDSIQVSDFSWGLSTKPRSASGYKSTAHIVVDSRYTQPFTLGVIEDILYGNETGVARLPTAAELVEIFDTPVEFTVTDNGSGTYIIAGPAANVFGIGDNLFIINHPNVVDVDGDTYTVSS